MNNLHGWKLHSERGGSIDVRHKATLLKLLILLMISGGRLTKPESGAINYPVCESPKLSSLPGGQRGGTKFLEIIRGRGAWPRVSAVTATSNIEPAS